MPDKTIYNHAYTIAFTVRSRHLDEDVTAEELAAGLKLRIKAFENRPEELISTCDASFDTYVEFDGREEGVVIYGSNGEFVVSKATGFVITPTIEMPDEYRDIASCNIQECREYYQSKKMFMPDRIDILNIGVTTTNGVYDPPDPCHRKMSLSNGTLVIKEK